ncbi:NAD(P)-binding domain-containing protein [Streptomyces sp. YIM 121038]|uniref:NADPH-dependent F420 reductase n=1 Tax=Streptomyces sp. YIM 121038 TaxID=2136401 RepID=UPI0022A99294|nr:NAD(P)-binding domain-containing protein [Streptomyces sp. YIM 121038]
MGPYGTGGLGPAWSRPGPPDGYAPRTARTSVPGMRIGVIGTGNVGRALATAWAAAGHDVVLGSRDPGARKETGAQLGLPLAGVRAAAAGAEVVVNATPGADSVALLRASCADVLDGKVLIDVAVGFTVEPHGFVLTHPERSLGEEMQRAFPAARVVKTLSTMDSAAMVAPDALAGESTVFLSGDDPAAKAVTAGLLTDLGWPPASHLDLGGIDTARGQEHFAHLFVALAGALGTHTFNVRVVPPAGR